jgi:hypothetical protein
MTDEERRERKLIIIEFAVPYGKKTDEITGDTLKEADHRKRVKLAGLVGYLRGKLGQVRSKYSYKVIFKTMIVSSLGVVPGFTIRNFSNIIGNKKRNQVEIWIKRLVIAALKGSFNLWMKAAPRVSDLMQTKVNLNKLERKNERLGLEVNEELITQDLKAVMLAETEGKEIDDMVTFEREAVERVIEFYEPQIADTHESENEQEIGFELSQEQIMIEKEECEEMLSEINAPKVEKRNEEKIETVRVISDFKPL